MNTTTRNQLLVTLLCWVGMILVIIMDCHKSHNGDTTLNTAIKVIQQYNTTH